MLFRNSTDRCAFAVGIAFFVFGLIQVVWPKPGVVLLSTNDDLGSTVRSDPIKLTVHGSRVIGIVTALVGIGFAGAALIKE